MIDFVVSVSALKPEEMPEVRMETEERQSAGYEVYHEKLVAKPSKPSHQISSPSGIYD